MQLHGGFPASEAGVLELAVELAVEPELDVALLAAPVELALAPDDSEETAVELPPADVALDATDDALETPVDSLACEVAELLAPPERELDDFLAPSCGDPESGVEVLELLEQALATRRTRAAKL